MTVDCKGAIFDLDGVLTDTASLHNIAWKKMFDEFLRDYYIIQKRPFFPFDEKKDYLNYVDGKPRYLGVREFLNSRNIELPYGRPNDSPNKKTVCGLGNKKNQIYINIIKKQKIKAYKSSISLVKKLKKAGIKVGVVSSSKNCWLILKKTGLRKLFEVVVDGITSEKKHLRGKPAPDIFIYAAKKLGIYPGECVIFEDAISGVKAGMEGNFGMVVGIVRDDVKLLGADRNVKDLKEISLRDINNWFTKGVQKDSWILEYQEFVKQEERLREVLCTIGNGYVGTRGCFETQRESPYHYPGCYAAGIYNELTTKIKNHKARNNSLVNCPNWLLIQIKIGNSNFVDPFDLEIIDYHKKLDTKNATLCHSLTFKDKKGRITNLESTRLASMHNPHICTIHFKIKPINYSGKITIQSLIDGNVRNRNVARYRGLKSKHLKIISNYKTRDKLVVHAKTNNSGYDIVTSARNIFKHNNKVMKQKKKTVRNDGSIGEEITFKAKEKNCYDLEKVVIIYTSNDTKKPIEKALLLLDKSLDFQKIYKKHKNSWKNLWDRADICIERGRHSQKILRLHIYHLLSTYSPHVKNLDVGIPARGLHGEGYRGHIFWDEFYTLPFFIHRFPEVAKASLLYRCRRLGAAQQYAKENGYQGAMYPWQSTDTGKEEIQTIHYNPRDGKWGLDHSKNQRHISIAIFYNFYKYVQHTNDIKFLHDHAAKVMIEITRFWSSIATYDKKTKKYHIKGVMGPDEYHERYPNTKRAFNDNAYTNVMTSWLMEKALEIVKKLPDNIRKNLNVQKKEIQKWKDISKSLNIVVKNGIIMQFDGFDKLKKLDFDRYKAKYGNIERMDRILKQEGKNPDDYQILKQADAMMIFYTLDFKEALRILRKLGVRISNPIRFLKENYDYYIAITTHGSSLSRFVHNAIAAGLKRKEIIWKSFKKTLETDIYSTQGESTSEGVHLALMAGSINIVRKYLAGVKTHPEGITIRPYLPRHWKNLEFRIVHRGLLYHFKYAHKELSITLESPKKSRIMTYRGRKYKLTHKKPVTFKKIIKF